MSVYGKEKMGISSNASLGLTYETKTVHFPGSLMGSTLLDNVII